MPDFKWHDGKANQTGVFQIKHNGDWVNLSQGYSIPSNQSESFSVESDFDGSAGAYVTFVTMISDTLRKGVKLTTAHSPVSLTVDTGSSDIEFRASVLISDDPKVHITTSRGGVATCYLSWDGSSWTFSGDGAPATGSDTFNVTANQVTIVVTNAEAGTYSSIYLVEDTANTIGTIVQKQPGSLSTTLTGAAGTYTVNVFQPLDTAATLYVSD
jgi:hypothetical protein